MERFCSSFGKKLAEIGLQVPQSRPAPVMDAAKSIQSQLAKLPTGPAQFASPPKLTIRLNTVEQTPPRTPPRPPLEASLLVEAASAPPKVETKIGETTAKQILKPTESLTVVRKDTLEKGYYGLSLTRCLHSELFDYQGKSYVVFGPVEINLVVDGSENRTKALVVDDANLPEPIVGGKHDI